MKKKTTTKTLTTGGAMKPFEGNPANPHYKAGLDKGRRDAESAIMNESPYHQLLHSKHSLRIMNQEKENLESQIDSLKKRILVEEEKIKGLKNQVEESIK